MTTNQDRPYHAASFIDGDEVWLRLYRTTSTPGVYLTVTDDVAAVSVSFNLHRRSLDRLIAALQLESKLLGAPGVGERRRAPADHPYRVGCEAIRMEAAPPGLSQAYRWFVYRGSASGVCAARTWLTDVEVADWAVIE